MIIKLNKLELWNFMGLRSFILQPEGESCSIRGVNGSGKTTLFNAFSYLLFGKDSQGKTDFAIKTLDKDGKEIPNIEHSVEGVFEVDNQIVTLKKVFREKWTKRRGDAQKEFTGHETQHYINEIPIQQKDWNARISNLIDEETFKLLTSPTFFNQSLHWEKRRALLLEVCGDISDADVIASDKALAALPEILGNKTIKGLKAIITEQRKKINDRLKEIPSRIDELQKSLTDVSKYDIDSINAEIKGLDDQIQAMKDDTVRSNLRKQKAELQAKLSELEAEKSRAYREATREINDEVEALGRGLREKKTLTAIHLEVISGAENTIKRNKEKMDRLREEYAEIAGKSANVTDTCPTCGQALPEDQVQAAIKKHNEKQAQRLAEINADGKQLKEVNEQLAKKIEEATKEGIDNDAAITELKAQIELKSIPMNVPFDTSKIDKVKTEIEGIEKQLTDNLPPNTSPLEELRKALQAKIAEVDATKRTRTRIKELGVEEKMLSAEYEDLERQIALMERFTVTKVNLLEEKINSRFSLARFKLFKQNINGGIEDTCETLYHGTPHNGGLSTGEQIVIGCDIISTLQAHYNILAPVFIDHKESLTSELNMDCQTISLIADEKHKELEVTEG